MTPEATLGQGPKWVSRWIRLQEVARILSTTPNPDVAALAVDLGYTDQAPRQRFPRRGRHDTGRVRTVASRVIGGLGLDSDTRPAW